MCVHVVCNEVHLSGGKEDCAQNKRRADLRVESGLCAQMRNLAEQNRPDEVLPHVARRAEPATSNPAVLANRFDPPSPGKKNDRQGTVDMAQGVLGGVHEGNTYTRTNDTFTNASRCHKQGHLPSIE